MRIKKINPKKLLEFENFAGPGLVSKTLFGSFRDNVMLFVQNFAEIEDYTVDDMPIWCTLLVTQNKGAFPLFIVEETVWNSENPYCNHCKLSGDLKLMDNVVVTIFLLNLILIFLGFRINLVQVFA